MIVLDEEPYRWLLLQEGEVLYLEAFCSHSAADYLFLIALDEEERRLFQTQGRSYLDRLAHDIHYSAPGVRGSRSRFKSRSLNTSHGDQVRAAWDAWRSAQDAPPA